MKWNTDKPFDVWLYIWKSETAIFTTQMWVRSSYWRFELTSSKDVTKYCSLVLYRNVFPVINTVLNHDKFCNYSWYTLNIDLYQFNSDFIRNSGFVNKTSFLPILQLTTENLEIFLVTEERYSLIKRCPLVSLLTLEFQICFNQFRSGQKHLSKPKSKTIWSLWSFQFFFFFFVKRGKSEMGEGRVENYA